MRGGAALKGPTFNFGSTREVIPAPFCQWKIKRHNFDILIIMSEELKTDLMDEGQDDSRSEWSMVDGSDSRV